MMRNYAGYGHMNFLGFGGGLGLIIPLLFWILVILAIIGFVKWILEENHGRETRKKEDSATNILKERYAKGEISKENLRARKRI